MDCAKNFLLNGKNRQSDYFLRRLAPRNLGRGAATDCTFIDASSEEAATEAESCRVLSAVAVSYMLPSTREGKS